MTTSGASNQRLGLSGRSRRRCCTTRDCGEISGHWGKYRENMFPGARQGRRAEHDFSLKPMNCPSHHLYFGTRKHSYREAATRLRERSTWPASERGLRRALGGLTRVRQFQQGRLPHLPDGQPESHPRSAGSRTMILELYADVRGLRATLKFATRPEQRIGERKTRCGDRARGPTSRAARSRPRASRTSSRPPADGRVSTGPRSTSKSPDSIGAQSGSWARSSSTTPRPSAFDLIYVGEDNAEHRPVVIHRAHGGIVRALPGDPDRATSPARSRSGWHPSRCGVIPISDAQTEAARGSPRRGSRPWGHSVRTSTIGTKTLNLPESARGARLWKVPRTWPFVGQREADSDSPGASGAWGGERSKEEEVITAEAFSGPRLPRRCRHGALVAVARRGCMRPGRADGTGGPPVAAVRFEVSASRSEIENAALTLPSGPPMPLVRGLAPETIRCRAPFPARHATAAKQPRLETPGGPAVYLAPRRRTLNRSGFP